MTNWLIFTWEVLVSLRSPRVCTVVSCAVGFKGCGTLAVKLGSTSELRREFCRLLGFVNILMLMVGLLLNSIEFFVLKPASTLD